MTKFRLAATTAAFLIGATGASLAQTAVTATTDLNVRAGPGPQYPVVTVLGVNQQAMLDGCGQGSKWCQITVNDQPGWAYSDYLSSEFAGSQRMVVTQRPASASVPVVEYHDVAGAAPMTATMSGDLVTGQVVGEVAQPTQVVRQYVTTNQIDPVYLNGEVVVGASVPDTVRLTPVPDYQYDYAYVNGQPVLIDPGTRQIVYVVRQ